VYLSILLFLYLFRNMVDLLDDLKTCIADEDVDSLSHLLKRVPDQPNGLDKLYVVSADLMKLAARKGHVYIIEAISQLGVDLTDAKTDIVR